MSTPLQTQPDRYQRERQFFDEVAARARLQPMSQATLERYAHPRRPHLFAKEMMFALAGNLRGKHVLEIGCGEGVVSTQLAWCGARVTGIDLSPRSIEVARCRAEMQGVQAEFQVGNVETDELGESCYDIVWCDLILHHLVGSLDSVLRNLHRALKPGGLFLAREPIAYAGWLKALRRLVPVHVAATPDEQPLRTSEFALIAQHFPGLNRRYYRLLARVDRITSRLPVIACAAAVDCWLFTLPGVKPLAGNVVLWANK